MSTCDQICFVIKKNLLISFRNKEFFIESILPIVVAGMLSLKAQLQAIQQLMPLLYSIALTSTQRSMLIKLVEEKSKRFKELQKIMGMNEKAYTIGWVLTGYIRIGISVLIFEFSWLICNAIFDINWEKEFHVSFSNMLWPYILFAYAVRICYQIQAMNQNFLLSSLFNEVKIAGEMQSFLQIAFTFFIYFSFVENVANKVLFYILMTMISPQCGIAFSYISSMNSEVGTDLTKLNLFPTEIISDTYPNNLAGLQLAIQLVVYFILFIYFEQVIPNEYGIAKHPLFFLKISQNKKKNRIENSKNNVFAQLNESDSESSSAMYNEDIKMNSSPSIIIKNLLKRFGDLNAVDNISLHLYESQIFCLLGHNGAGKTTAINLLTGMIQKTSGQVSMYEMNLDTQLGQIRKSLGLCTQKDCLYNDLTVKEHLEFISGIKGRLNQQEIEEILQKTELLEEQNKKILELSGGSKRKLSLAMSLVGDSKIIFLDEPTSGMDAYSRRSIWNILERIREDKRTIILTTHHLDEAELLANRIGIMSKGQLLAVGSSDFIKRKFGEGYNLKLSFDNNNLRNQIYDKVNEMIPNCYLETQHSNDNKLVFNIPFSSKGKLGNLFYNLESFNITIGLEMKTLEDAFVKIGLEDEKTHLNYVRKSEIRLAKQSMGIPAENDDNTNQINENEDFNSLPIIQEFTEEKAFNQNIPDCLKNDPQYKLSSQLLAIFLRRYYTVIRTSTNYFSILIPMLTFILGMTTVAGVDFDEILKNVFPDMNHDNLTEAVEFFKISLLSSCSVLAFCFNATVYITQPVLEKETYLKQALIGMGCRTLPYWVGTLIFDYTIYLCFVVLFYIISAILNLDIAFKYLGAGLSCYLLFGFSYILFAYLMGFLFKTLENALKLYSMFCFFVNFCVPFILIAFIDFFYKKFDSAIAEQLIYILQVFFVLVSPFYAFFEACTFLADNFQKIYDLNLYNTPQLIQRTYAFQLILLAQIIVQIIILYLIESKSFILTIATNQEKKQQQNENLEQEIIDERLRIEQGNIQDPIICKDLEKEYIKDKPTLQQLTFAVKKGEIFGIIGPNGAGKSTLINVFTGINTPSKGVALINGVEPKQRNQEIMQHVGICPQFDCIWENLTPIEHLQLFGRIKGLQGNDLRLAVNYYIKTMQLDLFVKTKAGQLSGGNKRKLCVADALIGGSDITFFDEPSTGVDPISRRFLFNTLQRNIQLRNCSAIMTTHTIEEAESLSQRLGILIAGQFKCLGTPQYLRQKYSKGYQISIKFNYVEESQVQNIQNSIQQEFPSINKLDDKRTGFMTFSINNSSFSFYKTFQYFETLIQNGIIEDFQINESSLEQIFIHFSRIQQEINEKEGVIFD
ncbi:unnamed protein product [Paramecium sonneborni]|uniref:ABC transporter domain-containing protein n=1 Tax=Paramecium sonneborni TaxID=65129 RepID=A0A8S1KC43_9CILI|nr:unnamed protein product [Paramecium sonneborni]